MELARELHRGRNKKFKTRQIITRGIDHIWAADLLIMSKYSKENKGFKYILNVIDTFSKFVWCAPLKKKTAREVSEAFEDILKKSGRKPNLLHTDRGTEFVNATFRKLLAKNHITLYHTFNELKSSIIERYNRTLNDQLRLRFEAGKNHRWFWVLQPIVREYNEKSVHRTIGCPPAQVSKKNESEILQRIYPLSKFKLEKPIFRLGQRVRITKKLDLFGVKYLPKWTTEIFQISKIHNTNPITYSIIALDGEEILGHFYRQELQATKF
jgi:hypothetical protein